MRLHVLAGCRELLLPDSLEAELAASLVGPKIRLATAFWLSPKCGRHYHLFLQDSPGDRRTHVLALTLGEDFGKRFEPLLVLPDLLNEVESRSSVTSSRGANVRSRMTVLSEVTGYGTVKQIRLHALAFPAEMDSSGIAAGGSVTEEVRDRLSKLCIEWISQTGAENVDTNVIEVTPESPAYKRILHNAVSSQVATRLASRLNKQYWMADAESLAIAVSHLLSDWQKKGVVPVSTINGKQIDALTEIIHTKWF